MRAVTSEKVGLEWRVLLTECVRSPRTQTYITLTADVTVLGGVAFGRRLDHEDRALVMGLAPSQKRPDRAPSSLPTCEDTGRRQLSRNQEPNQLTP